MKSIFYITLIIILSTLKSEAKTKLCVQVTPEQPLFSNADSKTKKYSVEVEYVLGGSPKKEGVVRGGEIKHITIPVTNKAAPLQTCISLSAGKSLFNNKKTTKGETISGIRASLNVYGTTGKGYGIRCSSGSNEDREFILGPFDGNITAKITLNRQTRSGRSPETCEVAVISKK